MFKSCVDIIRCVLMQRRIHLSDVTIKRGCIFVDEKQSGKRPLVTEEETWGEWDRGEEEEE